MDAAAARLGSSASGVSQTVSALEASTGTRLFDRSAKPVVLTSASKVSRVHAHRILSTISEAQTELSQFSLKSMPSLGLAIIDDLDATLMPLLATLLQERFRDCSVHTFSGRPDLIAQRLAARDADTGITGLLPPDIGAFRVIPVLRDSFVLVSAKGAFRGAGDWRTVLPALAFIQNSEAMPIGQLVAAHLRRINLVPPNRFPFKAIRSVIATVARAGGWTLTTTLNLPNPERVLAEVDIAPSPFAGFSRRISVVARTGQYGNLPDDIAIERRRLARERLIPTSRQRHQPSSGRLGSGRSRSRQAGSDAASGRQRIEPDVERAADARHGPGRNNVRVVRGEGGLRDPEPATTQPGAPSLPR